MQVVKAYGSPEEFGRSYGTQAKALIQCNTSIYGQWLRRSLSVPELAANLSRFQALLQQHAPSLLEELTGIAYGADVPLQDLILLGSRSELITLGDAWGPPECTSVAVRPEQSVDGIARVAQNWDWLHEMKGNQIILHGQPSGGPDFISFCEAGHLAKISINEYGLAVGLNFLHAPPGEIKDIAHGLPIHFLLRMVLKAHTVAEAVQLLTELPRGDGANFMMADADGIVASVELRPSGVDVIPPSGGLVTHANDYECGLPRAPRSQRLYEILTGRKLNRDAIWDALADHRGGICNHPNGPGSAATIVSVILEPTSRSLWVADGLPCEKKAPILYQIHPSTLPDTPKAIG